MELAPLFRGIAPMPLGITPEQENALLRQQILSLQKVYQDIAHGPMQLAFVIKVGARFSKILKGGALIEVLTPGHIQVRAGSLVHVDAQTNAILGVDPMPHTMGKIFSVKAVVDEEHVEIDMGPMGPRLAIHDGGPIEAGDRVILDPSGCVVCRNLGQPKLTHVAPIETGVTWEDIGGLEDVKAMFLEALEGAVHDRELLERYGQKPVRGILLAGPPGCGKTMLGRATATALAKLHGKETAGSAFQYVSGPSLLSKWVGQSEGNVRKLFENAHLHKKEHGYTGVIFLDEADALLSERGRGQTFDGMAQTIVPQFLTEMDGILDSSALVIAATNRPDVLDPAITREGRLDFKISMRRPNQPELVDIARRQMRSLPLEDQTLDEAAEALAKELTSDVRALYMVRCKEGKDRRFGLAQIVSGAMSAGLIGRAASAAIRREKRDKKRSGIRREDLRAAADALCREHQLLSHETELTQFVQGLKGEVLRVEKVQAAA